MIVFSLLIFSLFFVLYLFRATSSYKSKKYLQFIGEILSGALFWAFYLLIIRSLKEGDGGLGSGFSYVFGILYALPFGSLVTYGAISEILDKINPKRTTSWVGRFIVLFASFLITFLLLQLHY